MMSSSRHSNGYEKGAPNHSFTEPGYTNQDSFKESRTSPFGGYIPFSKGGAKVGSEEKQNKDEVTNFGIF